VIDLFLHFMIINCIILILEIKLGIY